MTRRVFGFLLVGALLSVPVTGQDPVKLSPQLLHSPV